jgi:hypothetical protein
VRQPVRLDSVEALEVEQRLDIALAGRIPVEHRLDIGAQRFAPRRIVAEQPLIGLADQNGRHVGMVEPLRNAVDHRLFEARMVEDGGIQEAGEHRLAFGGDEGFLAHACPDRIDGLQPLVGLSGDAHRNFLRWHLSQSYCSVK